jgi:hypothetical protein
MANSEKPVPPAAPPRRTTGLSPKEQKLQAMRAKLAAQDSGSAKPAGTAAAGGSFHAKSNVARKTSFQRKAT